MIPVDLRRLWIARAVRGPNWWDRFKAARPEGSLDQGMRAHHHIFQPLSRALMAPDPEARQAAAWALERLGAPEGFEPLADALMAHPPRTRHAYAEALLGLGARLGLGRRARALVDLCRRDPRAQREAAVSLAEIGAPEDLERLVRVLGRCERGAFEALVDATRAVAARHPTPQIVEAPLLDLLEQGAPATRVAAAQALGGIGGARAMRALRAALGDKRAQVRWAALEALAQLEIPVEVLAEELRPRPGDSTRLCRGLCRALEALQSPHAHPGLLDLLSDHRSELRDAAALVLRSTGEALLGDLVLGEEAARRRAAEALGRAGSRSAIKPLLRAASSSQEIASSAEEALIALSLIHGAQPIFEELLTLFDPDWPGLTSVLEGFLREGGASGEIITALQHNGPAIHEAAYSVLSRGGQDAEMVGLLIDLLDQDSARIRQDAALLLGECAVGEKRAVAADALAARLKPERSLEQVSTRYALGQLGDQRAVEPLLEILSWEVPGSLLYIVEVLVTLGDSRAVEPLRRLAEQPERAAIRGDLFWAATRIEDPEAWDRAIDEVVETCSSSQK